MSERVSEECGFAVSLRGLCHSNNRVSFVFLLLRDNRSVNEWERRQSAEGSIETCLSTSVVAFVREPDVNVKNGGHNIGANDEFSRVLHLQLHIRGIKNGIHIVCAGVSRESLRHFEHCCIIKCMPST